MSETTANIHWDHILSENSSPGSDSLDDWLNVRWFRMRIRSWSVPMLPHHRLSRAADPT
ncbi:MAG: hypothetical protein ACI841_000317 [Planctomycetota bacterium]|jgi:hypothetical protein